MKSNFIYIAHDSNTTQTHNTNITQYDSRLGVFKKFNVKRHNIGKNVFRCIRFYVKKKKEKYVIATKQ